MQPRCPCVVTVLAGVFNHTLYSIYSSTSLYDQLPVAYINDMCRVWGRREGVGEREEEGMGFDAPPPQFYTTLHSVPYSNKENLGMPVTQET